MTTGFKVGDEVEFTRRGIVSQVGEWFDGRAFIRVGDREIKIYADDRVTLIKAAAPVWRLGDVVHVSMGDTLFTLLRGDFEFVSQTGGKWVDEDVAQFWRDGDLEIVERGSESLVSYA